MHSAQDELDNKAPFKVSVVVPTYNRCGLLTRTLDSLISQIAPGLRYEVLVVDNNSRDDTRGVVDAIGRRHAHLRYVFEPRQGVSHARNAGIAASRAPLIAFIDDDVEASATWVAAIKQAFDLHPEIDCLGGPIQPRWAAPPPAWLTPMLWAAVSVQGDKGDSPYIDATRATPCLMTANFACRRAALEQVGGFSTAYARDEDRELQLRLWRAGKRGLYARHVIVTTDVPRDRLTKTHHRRFYARIGQSHARMRYLESIDAGGRLLRVPPRRTTVQGTPAFIYRYLFGHTMRLLGNAAVLRWNRAFFHEIRVRYYVGYIRARHHDEGPALRALPGEITRLLVRLVRRPFRRYISRLSRRSQAA